MVSMVCVEFTDHAVKIIGWSVAFCPTLGRSKTEGIPRAVNVFLSPIPEFIKMVGVPIGPAERIISLTALAVNRDPPEER
jgi:hypothetical protein